MEHTHQTILVVDDEWRMRNLIKQYLKKEKWEILEAETGEEALRLIQDKKVDLVLLDIMMPKMDGWQVCSNIRERSHMPILFLTARNETRDKVQGLRLGADDYLTKPFEMEELVARIHALLRRAVISEEIEPAHVFSNGELLIYPESREVKINDQAVSLTPKEFDLLLLLAQHPKKAFTRDNLLEQVWGHDFFGDIRTVDQHVKNIREKLKKSGCSFNPVKTLWGVGYQFQQKAPAQ